MLSTLGRRLVCALIFGLDDEFEGRELSAAASVPTPVSVPSPALMSASAPALAPALGSGSGSGSGWASRCCWCIRNGFLGILRLVKGYIPT